MVFEKSATTNENKQVKKNPKRQGTQVPRFSRQEPIGGPSSPSLKVQQASPTGATTGRPKVNGEQVNLCGKQGTRTTVGMEKKANLV